MQHCLEIVNDRNSQIRSETNSNLFPVSGELSWDVVRDRPGILIP